MEMVTSGGEVTERFTATGTDSQTPLSVLAKMVVVPLLKLVGLFIGILPSASAYQLTLTPVPPFTTGLTWVRSKMLRPVPSSQSERLAELAVGAGVIIRSTGTGFDAQVPFDTEA